MNWCSICGSYHLMSTGAQCGGTAMFPEPHETTAPPTITINGMTPGELAICEKLDRIIGLLSSGETK